MRPAPAPRGPPGAVRRAPPRGARWSGARRGTAAAAIVAAATLWHGGSGGGGVFAAAARGPDRRTCAAVAGAGPALAGWAPATAAWRVGCGAAGGAQEAVAARERFLSVLQQKGGDWRDEAVLAELKILEAANPTPDPALTGEFLDAEWLQVTRPDYNYGGNKGSTEYTLGALSFNMYEPADMKVRVERTTQLVAPGANGTREWDISLLITCIDERYPPFRANITTFGKIKPAKDKEGRNRRLEVWFTEGQLKLASGTDAEMQRKWVETMRSAQKDKKTSLGTIVSSAFMWLTMGLHLPSSVADDGTIGFSMDRPPHGYTDILYIDDVLRVTRGNRGSIVAVTRKTAG